MTSAARVARADVAFILLVHNEVDTIDAELREIATTIVSELPSVDFIVAEDGSRDGTREKLVALQPELGFRLVGGGERKGYARAWKDALAAANAEWICICDGGLKHDPHDFWKLYEARNGADLVVGRKTNRKDPLYRQTLTKAFNLVLRLYFGIDVHDADSGLRIMHHSVFDRIVRPGLSFHGFVSTELVVRAVSLGMRYREVPIEYRRRAGGASRALPLKNIPRAVVQVLGDLRNLKHELSSPH